MEVELTCQFCKNKFKVPFKQRDKKYCNRSCYFNDVKLNNKKSGRNKDESIREDRKCKTCGKIFNERKKYKKDFCSQECRVTWLNKPENRKKQQENIKKTVKQKYGVDHVWKVKSIHKKTIENRDIESIVEKQKETVKKKHLEKLLPKLKDSGLILLDEYESNKDGNTSKPYKFKCVSCDNVFTSTLLGSGIIPKCTKCNPTNRNTSIQTFITDFLSQNNVEFILNHRKLIPPKEVDIFLPNHNIAIEVNGLYWHGELNNKDKFYHLNKTIECKEKGVQLLHFFEDEILNNGDIILSILRNKLKLNTNKVYARKCSIRVIDSDTKKDFLNKNHIFGGNTKDSIRLGLFYENELVSVMSVSKRKITRGEPTWEIVRFASKLNYSVIGGFSKLLKFLLKNYEIDRLITFADLRFSDYNHNNTVYFKNGFKFEKNTHPNYWYFYRPNNKEKYNRYKFRKDVLVSEGFDPNKTEWEIMQERNFDRIWDCGSSKFFLTK